MFIGLLLDFVFMRVYSGTPLSSEILNCEVGIEHTGSLLL